MKTIIILSTCVLTLGSFMHVSNTEIHASIASPEQVGRSLLLALQRGSIEEYKSLFPKLKDFYSLMDEDAAVYGPTLESAKREFARVYLEKVRPELEDSFAQIVRAGEARGIDWTHTSYLHAESNLQHDTKFGKADLQISFVAAGKEYTIVVHNALIIHGEWKVSQFAELR